MKNVAKNQGYKHPQMMPILCPRSVLENLLYQMKENISKSSYILNIRFSRSRKCPFFLIVISEGENCSLIRRRGHCCSQIEVCQVCHMVLMNLGTSPLRSE